MNCVIEVQDIDLILDIADAGAFVHRQEKTIVNQELSLIQVCVCPVKLIGNRILNAKYHITDCFKSIWVLIGLY